MRPLAILACLAVVACAHNRVTAPHIIPGPVQAAPAVSHGFTRADSQAAADEANAAASRKAADKRAAAAEAEAVNRAEIRGDMRLAIVMGVLVAALGCALIKYGAARLGLSVVTGGGGAIGAALLVTTLLPYLRLIACSAGAYALAAHLWHHRASVLALRGALSNTEHKLAGAAKRLVSRLRAKLPVKFGGYAHLSIPPAVPVTVTLPSAPATPATPSTPEGK